MSGAFSPRSFRPGGMRHFTVSKLSPPLNSMEPFPSALTAVLVFPLIPKPATCLQQVRLRLWVLGGRGSRAELAVYPSALLSLAEGRRPDPIPLETLIDNRPRGTGTLTAGGAWLRVDLTALYRTWARGGPFPSQGRAVEPGTPLVVDVRPSVVTEPYFEARFDGLGGDRDTAPQLRWRVTRGC